MDAATLLDYYTHDLANLPAETRMMLKEIGEKDIEFDKIMTQIENIESQMSKYIKQHGSLVRHPKEDLLNEEIEKHFKMATDIQNEKILIANTALINIGKYNQKFQQDINRLVETGAIEHWDLNEDDLEIVNIDQNGSLSPSATPASTTRSTIDINEISKKFNSSSIDVKSQRSNKKSSRDRTPLNSSRNNNTKVKTEDEDMGIDMDEDDEKMTDVSASTPTRRRDVSAVMKGPNRNSNSNNGNGNGDDDELYCFCQQVSYGAMVACDNPNCKFEWFHYDCVGLKEPPSGVWYCPDCRKDAKNIKREKKKKV